LCYSHQELGLKLKGKKRDFGNKILYEEKKEELFVGEIFLSTPTLTM
jgi:hypothetical protein